MEAPEALGRAFSLDLGAQARFWEPPGLDFRPLRVAFAIIGTIKLSIAWPIVFSKILRCFVDRSRPRFSIALFIVLGARAATNDFAKP